LPTILQLITGRLVKRVYWIEPGGVGRPWCCRGRRWRRRWGGTPRRRGSRGPCWPRSLGRWQELQPIKEQVWGPGTLNL